MLKVWDFLTLQGAMIFGIVATIYVIHGQLNYEPTTEDVEEAQQLSHKELAWERCGQYHLKYYEADSGFYNCNK